MIRQIFIYFLVILNTSYIFGKKPICISLGDGCGPALMLRELGIRTEAFPFDWTVSPFNAVYEALISDFAFFLTNLQVRSDNNGVIDHYGINFTHDLPTIHNPQIDALNSDSIGNCELSDSWEEALPLVKEKYRRRIERLKKICLSENKVIFIRLATSSDPKQEALMLRNFFKNTYNQLDFILLVIGNNECFKTEWNISSIRNFYISSWCDTVGLASILQQVDKSFCDLGNKKNIKNASKSHITCKKCSSISLQKHSRVNYTKKHYL